MTWNTDYYSYFINFNIFCFQFFNVMALVVVVFLIGNKIKYALKIDTFIEFRMLKIERTVKIN